MKGEKEKKRLRKICEENKKKKEKKKWTDISINALERRQLRELIMACIGINKVVTTTRKIIKLNCKES